MCLSSQLLTCHCVAALKLIINYRWHFVGNAVVKGCCFFFFNKFRKPISNPINITAYLSPRSTGLFVLRFNMIKYLICFVDAQLRLQLKNKGEIFHV